MAYQKPAAVLIPIQSFIGELPNGDDFRAVLNVTRVRADHPAVKAWPHLFASDGTPSNELGAMRVALEPEYRPPRDPFGPQTPGPIPPERRVRATRNVFAGTAIAAWKGEIFDSNHPFVKKARDAFEPAPPEKE